ncbi:hypothetical protein [Dehalobacterium formicoaceticum]|uniref:hypothetical protein n=1 Tax=Dehalobacterium formicoaceticum TaxID=51515 RepID=UPI0031F5F62E
MPMVAVKKPYTLFLRDDTDVESPRESDTCFGTMVCFHRRYSLGDKHDYSSPEEFLRDIVRDGVPHKDVIEYVRSGKAGDVKFEYNRSSREWEVHSYWDMFKKWYLEASFPAPVKGQENDIADAMIEQMQIPDLLSLAEKTHCILPLYLYDHSGITMNTSGFSCPWDSGQVGWIYATKEAIQTEYDCKELTPEIREKAEKLLRGEVEYYDHYIRGDCYGFQLYKDGEEVDSCWGFIGDPIDLQADIEGYLPEECKGIMNNLVYRYDDPDIEDIMQEQEYELEVG